MDTNAELYAQDFYAWTQTTAALLRAGTWDALDRAALAEEIESVGKRERRIVGEAAAAPPAASPAVALSAVRACGELASPHP
jgi:hypothetical protein